VRGCENEEAEIQWLCRLLFVVDEREEEEKTEQRQQRSPAAAAAAVRVWGKRAGR
jgi:hypothetical protein